MLVKQRTADHRGSLSRVSTGPRIKETTRRELWRFVARSTRDAGEKCFSPIKDRIRFLYRSSFRASRLVDGNSVTEYVQC